MNTIKKKIFIWFVVGLIGILYPGFGAAFSENNINFEGKNVKIDGVIVLVNRDHRYLEVDDSIVYLIEIKLGKKRYKTSLKDQYGKRIPLKLFSSGQRVRVDGFKLSDGKILGGVVQQLPPN